MAVSGYLYPKVYLAAFNAEIDWVADTIRCALTTSSYTVSDAHDYFDDITNEVVGTGYVADGEALGTKTATFTDDASATAWVASTAYVVGDVVRPTSANGHVYQCVVAGTSNSGEPTWDTTPGQDTTDNTVVWTEAGRGLVTLDAANVSWTSSTITARYAIIYKDTGTASTSPLIGFIDFGQDESTTNGTFQVTFDDDGIFQFFAGYGGT